MIKLVVPAKKIAVFTAVVVLMTALAAVKRKSKKVNKYKESLSKLAGIFYFCYDIKDETLALNFKSF